ncbi:MAG: carboxypeptidase regulatory-like domain-containing protein [Planctomycetales bacterium]|nr:carboxypeptidase regulatory-like domain-containing protein [Planctomycetales bacterium]
MLSSRISSFRVVAMALVGIAVCVAGCGPDLGGRVPISGQVTLGGQPLNDGTIEFVASDGSSQTGTTISNGSFSLPEEKGLPPGSYIVRISSFEAGAAPEEAAPGDSSAIPEPKELIPAEYNVESNLTAEVTADGDNSFQFDIP